MQITNIPIDASQRETTRQGNADFPVAIYHSMMSRNVLGFTPVHWHPEMQFCLVTRGQILFRVQQEEVPVSCGDGIFIGSGYLHMAEPLEDPDSSYICIDFMPSVISSFSGSLVEKKYVLPSLDDPALVFVPLHDAIPWQQKILGLIAESSDCYEEKPADWEFALTILISRMFLLLLQNENRKEMPGRRKKETSPCRSRSSLIVQSLINYIAKHYAEKITLEDLSSEVSYAKSECCRLFKKYTGESIFSYLRSYRLEQSTYLLSVTSLSVTEIAYVCGFSSASYYIEHFRKQFGLTPLKYRQQSLHETQ